MVLIIPYLKLSANVVNCRISKCLMFISLGLQNQKHCSGILQMHVVQQMVSSKYATSRSPCPASSQQAQCSTWLT